MNIYWYRHRYSQCAVHIVVNHCLIHKKFNNTRTVVQMKFLLATILVYCEVFVQCSLLCGVWFTGRKVNKLSHQAYVGPISDLQYIRPKEHQALSTSGLSYIRSIVHQAFIMPVVHRDNSKISLHQAYIGHTSGLHQA